MTSYSISAVNRSSNRLYCIPDFKASSALAAAKVLDELGWTIKTIREEDEVPRVVVKQHYMRLRLVAMFVAGAMLGLVSGYLLCKLLNW